MTIGGVWHLFNLALHGSHDDYDWGLLVGFHLYPRRFHAHYVWVDSRLLCGDYRAGGFPC